MTRGQVVAGLAAGLAAGAVMELFLAGMQVARGVPLTRLAEGFSFIAATLLGPSAYSTAGAVPLGIGLYFCVAVGWALGYVYLVRSQPQLLAHPWLSGAAFGIVVYVFMQIVLLTAGQYHRPMVDVLAIQLIAHMLFYGIPVALIASGMLRPAAVSGRAG